MSVDWRARYDRLHDAVQDALETERTEPMITDSDEARVRRVGLAVVAELYWRCPRHEPDRPQDGCDICRRVVYSTYHAAKRAYDGQ